jgi:hypothetical protein
MLNIIAPTVPMFVGSAVLAADNSIQTKTYPVLAWYFDSTVLYPMTLHSDSDLPVITNIFANDQCAWTLAETRLAAATLAEQQLRTCRDKEGLLTR